MDPKNQVSKEEVQKLLAGMPPSPGFRFSRFSRFSRFPLALKIGTGYALMAVFTMAALLFLSFNLYAINRTAHQIANIDLPVISALIKMRESLLAQESFAGKYAILKDPAFREIFGQHKAEFNKNLVVLESSDSARDLAALKLLYRDYQSASDQLFAGKPGKTVELRAKALELLSAVDSFHLQRQERLQAVLKRSDQRQKSTIRWAIVIFCSGLMLAVWLAPFVTYRFFAALRKLQTATHRVAAGDFDCELQIPAEEEISELAVDFTQMATRLKELEQIYLDARPLTRLPGNSAIEQILDQRLKSGAPFAFCHAELHNFRPFGDHYGYAKGSDLLRVTGYLIYAAVKEHDGAEGFVGHVGGDHFVMVVSTERAAPVCEAVIKEFDAEVINHFTPEDQQAGGIERFDHHGGRSFFPLTTISIAVLNCGGDRYASAVEIARAAALAKDSLQELPGSSWIAAG